MVAVKAAFVLSLVLIVPKGTLNTGSKMFKSYLANTAIGTCQSVHVIPDYEEFFRESGGIVYHVFKLALSP